MKLRKVQSIALALLMGCQAAPQEQSWDASQQPVDPAAAWVSQDCAATSCLAPGVCADEARICPPGPDCFAPEICPDEAVLCSASAEACLAPESCSEEAVTCPPGPDCLAPEVCPDEAVICPAGGVTD